jgi:hypothetical protein
MWEYFLLMEELSRLYPSGEYWSGFRVGGDGGGELGLRVLLDEELAAFL